MRQIKFRAKSVDEGKWFIGALIPNGRRPCIAPFKEGFHLESVDPNTLGQFAGLTDCKGKVIYEGDIITVNGKYPRVVLWDKMSWALMPTEYFHDKMFWVMNLQHPGIDWWEEFADKLEVIGNIHDNPELIPTQPTEI